MRCQNTQLTILQRCRNISPKRNPHDRDIFMILVSVQKHGWTIVSFLLYYARRRELSLFIITSFNLLIDNLWWVMIWNFYYCTRVFHQFKIVNHRNIYIRIIENDILVEFCHFIFHKIACYLSKQHKFALLSLTWIICYGETLYVMCS